MCPAKIEAKDRSSFTVGVNEMYEDSFSHHPVGIIGTQEGAVQRRLGTTEPDELLRVGVPQLMDSGVLVTPYSLIPEQPTAPSPELDGAV
jgi:hypothetical protein